MELHEFFLLLEGYVRYHVHMNKIISATEARKNFFQLLKLAGKPGATVTVTLEGQSPVVFLSQEEFESWQETLEVMSDPELVKAIQEGLKDKETISLEEVERREHAGAYVHSHSQAKGRKGVRQAAHKGSAKNSGRTTKPAR
jgi:prevent-host-death family protein